MSLRTGYGPIDDDVLHTIHARRVFVYLSSIPDAMTLFTALVVAFNHLFLLSSAHVHNAHHHLHRDKRLLFDFTNKPVDVQGVHAFHPPTTGDQRGPCPGLNALANHGYISRDGVASFAEAVSAINEVYGMVSFVGQNTSETLIYSNQRILQGLDLATILATMGVVWGGAPVSLDPRFSIGGEDPAVSNLLDGLLGVLGKSSRSRLVLFIRSD